MTCHYTPSINFKSLMINAMFPTVYKYFFIFIPDKYINPVYNCKSYKIDFILIPEFNDNP